MVTQEAALSASCGVRVRGHRLPVTPLLQSPLTTPRPPDTYRGRLLGAAGGAPRGPGIWLVAGPGASSSAALSLSLCFLDFFLDLLCKELPWGLLETGTVRQQGAC